MEFRYLGNSGFKVSAVSYGNWVTHGSQVEADQATSCVRAALEAGITTFDTADVYANGKAESILGDALAGERRESLEIFTKVYFPTGPRGHNDTGLSRKHIHESINASLRRLKTDYVDLYQAHRYDHFTPLEETMEAFADVVRSGKALYIGVSEWTPDQLRAGHALARELRFPFVSNQPQYNALYRIIEAEVVPTCRELGISQVVFSPINQGILTGKYKPGEPVPEGSRATDESGGGAKFIKGALRDDVLTRVQQLAPLADAEGLTMAQLAVAWVLQNDNVATAITGGSRPEQVTEQRRGGGQAALGRDHGRDRRGPRRRGGIGRFAGRQGVAEEAAGVNWRWVPDRDPDDGSALDREFPSQGEAESWLGEFYPGLVDSGVRAVSLYEADRLVYGPMSLEPEPADPRQRALSLSKGKMSGPSTGSGHGSAVGRAPVCLRRAAGVQGGRPPCEIASD